MCCCDIFITYLSETTRRNLAALLMILQMCGLLLGVCSSVIGYYLKVTNVEMEGLVFETLMETMPEFLIYNGFVMGFLHTISFQLLSATMDWRKLYRNKSVCQTFGTVYIALVFMFLLSLLGLCMYGLFIADLTELYTEGFKEAMTLYYVNEDKREALNIIQATYRCCGANGYKDWFKERWVMAEHFYDNPKSQEALDNMEAGKVLVFSTPFSCCDPSIQRPCIFTNVVNDSLHFNYRHGRDITIFKIGCGQAIAESLGAVWIFIVKKGLIFTALFEACVLILFRYLQTSVNLALKFGDPTLTAQGYICLWNQILVPSGFMMSPEALQARQAELEELSKQTEEAPDFRQYDLSEDDKYWLEQGERLDGFLSQNLHGQ